MKIESIPFVFRMLLTLLWAAYALASPTLSNSTKLRIMPVGDSITHGFQGEQILLNGNGYRMQLWKDLSNVSVHHFVGSQFSGDLPDPYNEGYDGALISQIAEYINASLPSMRPNVVLIHAGTNDMIQSVNLTDAPNRLGSLIDEVTTACPDAAVLVAKIIVIANTTVNAHRETYNAAIPGVVAARANAGKKVQLIDLSALLTPADLIDGVHPFAEGYNKMGDAWFAGIQSLAQKGWIEDPVPLSNVDGKGCSSPPVWDPRLQISHGFGTGIKFADLNGDGKDDYLLLDNEGSVTAFINQGGDVGGNQTWLSQGEIFSGTASNESQVQFGDINGDGLADYLLVNSDGSVDAWFNAGSNDTNNPGKVTWVSKGQIAGPGMGQDGSGVIFADLNGDGLDDYLWVSESGAVTAYFNGGGSETPTWISQGNVTTGEGAARSQVAFADINGDGRADYLVIGATTGSVNGWINTAGLGAGGITWVSWGQIGAGTGYASSDILFADITGSKRDDYVIITNSTGAMDLWQNLCPVASASYVA